MIAFSVVTVLMMAVMFFLVFSTSDPKTPATTEQVWKLLTSQGYEPQDLTNKYHAGYPNAKERLNRLTAIEKDDIRFDFYDFNNKNSAVDIYGVAYSHLVTTKRRGSYVEYETSIANYHIYTLKSDGKYYVSIYVGTTAVYAYADAENEGKINEILFAIDYL